MRSGRTTCTAASLCGLTLLAACAHATPPPAPKPVATAPPICNDFSFPIYFETGSDQVSPAAMQVVADSAERVRGCDVTEVQLLGLADASGAPRANLDLSRRRAANVAAALAGAGLPRPVFDIGAAGQIGAVAPGGAPEPLRRRTEVVVRASPKQPEPAQKIQN